MPRRPPSPLPLPGAALLLFALALLEVGNRLELFPGVGIAVLAGLSAAAVLLGLLRRSGGFAGRRRLATALAGSALVAFGCRAFLGIETSPGPGAAPAAIDRVDGWLAEVTREIGDAARLLARAPNIAAAVEGSDAGDPRTGAFRALSEWPLPGTAIGRAGATLYDRGLRPVAWSGRSPALEAALARFFPEGVRAEDCPRARRPALPLHRAGPEGLSGRGRLHPPFPGSGHGGAPGAGDPAALLRRAAAVRARDRGGPGSRNATAPGHRRSRRPRPTLRATGRTLP